MLRFAMIRLKWKTAFRLGWALTIHKSQGLALPKALIDIDKSERTAAVSYVAITQVKIHLHLVSLNQ